MHMLKKFYFLNLQLYHHEIDNDRNDDEAVGIRFLIVQPQGRYYKASGTRRSLRKYLQGTHELKLLIKD